MRSWSSMNINEGCAQLFRVPCFGERSVFYRGGSRKLVKGGPRPPSPPPPPPKAAPLLQPDSGVPRSPSSSRNIWGAQDDQGDPIVQKWKCAPIYLWWQLINWGLHDRPDRTWCDPRACKRTNFDRSEEAFYMFVPNRFVYIPEMTGTGVARSRREIIWNACGQSYLLHTETNM